MINGATNIWNYGYLQNSDLISSVSNSVNPVILSKQYEPNRNLITNIKNVFGTTTISEYDYTNDELGRRTDRIDTMSSGITTNSFGYNGRSEVIAAALGIDNDFGYAFDNIGNRSSTTNNSETTDYIANSLNQYTEIADGVTNSPTYDADGNMLSNGDWTYTWNGENRLVSASNSTTVLSFSYDYMGRRFSKSSGGDTTTFVYDGWNMVRESSSTETNHYTWGLDLSQSIQGASSVGALLSVTEIAGYTYYPSTDGDGNISTYIDGSGTVVAEYIYDAFGDIVASSGTREDDFMFRFRSKYHDESLNRYIIGERGYRPADGRYDSRDPLCNTSLSYVYLRYDPNVYRYDLGSFVDPYVIMRNGIHYVYTEHMKRMNKLLFEKDIESQPVGEGQNTVKCEGGELVWQIGNPSEWDAENECTKAHEKQHIKDMKKHFGENVCKNIPDGEQPIDTMEFKHETECNAFKKGAECRRDALSVCMIGTGEETALRTGLRRDNQGIEKHCPKKK